MVFNPLKDRDKPDSNLDQKNDFRYRAALLSKGTSSFIIKELVLSLLDKYAKTNGTLCDFGAGNGELLGILQKARGFSALAGIDILEKPSSLDDKTGWVKADLNEDLDISTTFDTVVCSETIEHLENPRHCFRIIGQLVKPGGMLVLTMPNNQSIRSILGLVFAGHFTQFLGACYPPHITALLRKDLARLCEESGFETPSFHYSNHGCVPKMTWLTWQRISFGLFQGQLFSDNLAMVAKRCLPAS
jgi:2-polyprenyl-3-methyl-5-hydroxy-6-metoxy-1,4-benzoquinol methylase